MIGPDTDLLEPAALAADLGGVLGRTITVEVYILVGGYGTATSD